MEQPAGISLPRSRSLGDGKPAPTTTAGEASWVWVDNGSSVLQGPSLFPHCYKCSTVTDVLLVNKQAVQYLTIRQEAQVVYEQIANKAQPS